MKKIDYELLAQLCKEEDSPLKDDLGGDDIILHGAFIYESFIISSYRNISWPDFVLSLDVYLSRLKQKERESKLNELL